jgi:hypothetical protein
VNGFNLVNFAVLLSLHFLYFKELLTFFQDIFTHFHCLSEVMISILQDLLKGLLIELNHLLLVNKHLTLRILIRLARELHVRHLRESRHPRNLIASDTCWHRWQLVLESWWRCTKAHAHRSSHLHLRRLLSLILLSNYMRWLKTLSWGLWVRSHLDNRWWLLGSLHKRIVTRLTRCSE